MSFQEKWVVNGKVKIWTESFGKKEDPAVLLIVGAGAISISYSDRLCQKIADAGFLVIRYDQRDYGKSTHFKQIPPEILADPQKLQTELPYRIEDLVEDAVNILDAYGISQAHVVGHSMGGMVAQLLAATLPNRLLSFTSIGVAPASSGVELEPVSDETMRLLLSNMPVGNFEKDIDGWLESFKLLTGEMEFDEEQARGYVKEIYRRDPHPGVAWNHIGIQHLLSDNHEKFRKNKIPGLILHGQADPLQPVSYARVAHQMISNTKMIVLPKIGHMFFNAEAEDQIAKQLISFFKTI